MSSTFGPTWTRVLVDGAAVLGIPVDWVLAVIALESGFDPLARNASGARGLTQMMPRNGFPYVQIEPVRQIRDAFGFWGVMANSFRVGPFRSRESFYTLNLAPARLRFGQYDDETVLYSAPSEAYVQNASAFGLDPKDPCGVLRMRHLAVGLDAAVARCRARYDAELEAAEELMTRPAREYAENVQPAAVVTRDRAANG